MNEDRMTPEALAEIEGLAKKATNGTWVVDKMGRYEDHDECRIDLPDDEIELCRYENAEFVAASRLAVPQMAAEIRRAWALIQKVYEVAAEERFAEVTDIIDAENGGSHE